LFNQGTINLNADFTAGDGMENDSFLTIPTGRTITLNGRGLDNAGTLILNGGTLNLSATSVNTNRGTFVLYATVPFLLGGGMALTNQGVLKLNGSQIFGPGGINNIPNGTIEDSGIISVALSNSGTIEPTNGTLLLSGTVQNGSSGLMAVSSGNKLL